jgi:DNA-directed RNA polymerase specialized sigma24 family protein
LTRPQSDEPARPRALTPSQFGVLPAWFRPIGIGVPSNERPRPIARPILTKTAWAEELVEAEGIVRRGGRQDDGHRLELSAGVAAELHRFVARSVANPDDAADIAQHVLMLACAELSKCRGENLWPWLFTIANHLIVDHYRAQNRVRFVELGVALADTEPVLQTLPDTVLAICECNERLRHFLDFITRAICVEHQVTVLLADVYGHRDKHSAALLCMTVPSFKLLLHGARARLREIGARTRMPVKKTSAPAGDKSASGCGSKRAERRKDGLPSLHPVYRRLGVTCQLGAPALLALRDKLLEGLRH